MSTTGYTNFVTTQYGLIPVFSSGALALLLIKVTRFESRLHFCSFAFGLLTAQFMPPKSAPRLEHAMRLCDWSALFITILARFATGARSLLF